MGTKERLGAALREAGAPEAMVEKAKRGHYDEFGSESATPLLDLIHDAYKHRLPAIALRAQKGEFDANQDEAEAWFWKAGARMLAKHWKETSCRPSLRC